MKRYQKQIEIDVKRAIKILPARVRKNKSNFLKSRKLALKLFGPIVRYIKQQQKAETMNVNLFKQCYN